MPDKGEAILEVSDDTRVVVGQSDVYQSTQNGKDRD